MVRVWRPWCQRPAGSEACDEDRSRSRRQLCIACIHHTVDTAVPQNLDDVIHPVSVSQPETESLGFLCFTTPWGHAVLVVVVPAVPQVPVTGTRRRIARACLESCSTPMCIDGAMQYSSPCPRCHVTGSFVGRYVSSAVHTCKPQRLVLRARPPSAPLSCFFVPCSADR